MSAPRLARAARRWWAPAAIVAAVGLFTAGGAWLHGDSAVAPLVGVAAPVALLLIVAGIRR